MKAVGVVEWTAHAAQSRVLQSKARFRVWNAGRRSGKALALDTPIPTPSGWTTMGALREGDSVFDEHGNPCRVTFATDTMHDRQCYEVIFSDGSTIVADEDHQWLTWTKRARKEAGRLAATPCELPSVKTTNQIRESLRARGETNHSIPTCGPLQYPECDLVIDPYVLGAWLGDGSSYRASIFTADMEVIDEIHRAGYPAYKAKEPFEWYLTDGVRSRFKPRAISRILRLAGLFGNKHIPEAYLRASVPQRLALLQGLMDTDGSCTTRTGICEFTSTTERLARAVLELTRGLGIKSTLTTKHPLITGRPEAACALAYRVTFRTSLPVFRLKRKLDHLTARPHRMTTQRMITDVCSVPSVPVRCIQVDSPSHLYLAGEACIPTHNTELAAVFMIQQATRLVQKGHDPASLELWWVAPTWELARRGFNKLKKRTRGDGGPNPLNAYFLTATESPGNLKIHCHGGWVIQFKSAENEDQLRGEGVHACVVDEAASMRGSAWDEGLYPALTDTGGVALLISTPKGRNWFYAMHTRGQDADEPEYASWSTPSWENPQLDRRILAAAKRDLPHRVHDQEYGAVFLDDAGGVFRGVRGLVTSSVKYRGPAASRGWDLQAPQTGVQYVAGWDPAKHMDWSVLTILRMPERHVVHFDRFQTIEYDQQCRRVAQTLQRYNGAHLLMDSTGAGDPLYDFMRKLPGGARVEGLKFTSQSKADLVNELALAIDNGTVSYPDLPVLVNELEVFEATRSAAGNVRYSAPEGLHDDAVVSLALALKRSMTRRRLIVG